MGALNEAVKLARSLGLNQLEAEVYAFLLSSEPVTAYAIGRSIRRPTANVYKSVERLSRIGAVMIEEGDNRLCRAVEVGEFVRHTKQQFNKYADAAELALSQLQKESYDERIYRIEAVPEVLVRAQEMLDRAKKVVVIDAFPNVLSALAQEVTAAAERGVNVYVEAYRDISVPGAEVVIVPGGEDSLKAWRSEQLNLVVDGQEHLLALLSADLSTVYQAVWSRSVYLSCILHAGRMAEFTLIQRMLMAGSPAEAAQMSKHFFSNSEVPGHDELMRRYRTTTG